MDIYIPEDFWLTVLTCILLYVTVAVVALVLFRGYFTWENVRQRDRNKEVAKAWFKLNKTFNELHDADMSLSNQFIKGEISKAEKDKAIAPYRIAHMKAEEEWMKAGDR